MTSSAVPAVPQRQTTTELFGGFWPERDLAARPRLVLASLAAGLLAAVVVPFRDLGIGTFVVLMTVAGVVVAADARRRNVEHLGAATLCVLLVSTVFLRDAEWIVVLCVLASFVVAVTTLTEARSFFGLVAAGFSVPLAALRGLPWLARSSPDPAAGQLLGPGAAHGRRLPGAGAGLRAAVRVRRRAVRQLGGRRPPRHHRSDPGAADVRHRSPSRG